MTLFRAGLVLESAQFVATRLRKTKYLTIDAPVLLFDDEPLAR